MMKAKHAASNKIKHPKYLSFFSGALGLDLGLEASGLQCLAANENDSVACETIRKNRPNLRLFDFDIRKLTRENLRKSLGSGVDDLFAVAGGPPCQAFSTAGRRLGLNDDRGNVFLHFIELAIELSPQFIVFENVRGLLSAPLRHRPHKERDRLEPLDTDELPGGALSNILKRLEDASYKTTFTLYNTANYGVPQTRERLIFFASRDGAMVPFLRKTHSESPKTGLLPWVTLRDAIATEQSPRRTYLQFPEKRLIYYRMLKAGENWRNLPADVLADAMGDSLSAGGGKTGFYRRLSWDKPSPTLLTRPTMKATDLCHPEELRPLTVEEYAAIQTFPADYALSGSVDDRYKQLGNAVPCRFGEVIGRHLQDFANGSLQAELETAAGFSRYTGTDHLGWRQAIQHQQAVLPEIIFHG